MHVSFFFRKTMKDGGKVVNPKAAIVEILEEENRSLYELSYNIPSTYETSKNSNY
jgi:hypothetical protein